MNFLYLKRYIMQYCGYAIGIPVVGYVVMNISVAPPQRESSVTVLEGVDATRTNMSFFRQQLQLFATHILRCTGTVSSLILCVAQK